MRRPTGLSQGEGRAAGRPLIFRYRECINLHRVSHGHQRGSQYELLAASAGRIVSEDLQPVGGGWGSVSYRASVGGRGVAQDRAPYAGTNGNTGGDPVSCGADGVDLHASGEMMTLHQYRDRVIELARASVERLETRSYRKRGCLRGLEIAASILNAEQFLREIKERDDMEQTMRILVRDGEFTLQEYWEFHCATAQVKFVYERMKPAYGCPGPLSLSALVAYREITGNIPSMEELK